MSMTPEGRGGVGKATVEKAVTHSSLHVYIYLGQHPTHSLATPYNVSARAREVKVRRQGAI
jgi:hypothetical protein